MRLLLDTHTLLWSLSKPDRLTTEARRAIQEESNDVFVSIVSPWEIAIKKSRGNLHPPDDLEAQLEAKRFGLLPLSMPHTRAVESLPPHHGDPFDRMLIAQAQVEGMTLVTSDRDMRRYRVALLPAT
jgi:PIN domain nuclease of toxin-antitoxin system